MIPSISAARSASRVGCVVGRGRAGRDQAASPLPAGTAARRRRRTPPGRRRLGRHVGAVVVGAGDDHGARHADRGALRPQRDGGRVDALERVDHEQGGVGGAQSGAQLADEVGVAGGVDEVDLDVPVHDRGHRQADRPLLADRRGIVVADRGAVGDRPGAGQHAGGGEQRLDQRGLARARTGRRARRCGPWPGRPQRPRLPMCRCRSSCFPWRPPSSRSVRSHTRSPPGTSRTRRMRPAVNRGCLISRGRVGHPVTARADSEPGRRSTGDRLPGDLADVSAERP